MWYDFYKLFKFIGRPDPISNVETPQGVGITSDVPNIRGNEWGGSQQPLRISVEGADYIDTASVQSRISRYKEYDRLQNVAEIENALTTFADEACVAGNTPVATPFGFVSIKELAETKKNERFLVYCWDFKKQDYTLGWAYNPRFVKTAPTVKIMFDDGKSHVMTPDHRVLLRSGEWVEAGKLKFGDLLMPFYRIPANQMLTKLKTKQFPRILTFHDGWKHERQFIDEWSSGKKVPHFEEVNEAGRYMSHGMTTVQIAKVMKKQRRTIEKIVMREGFSSSELRWLGKKSDSRRVIGIYAYDEVDVYDLSVEDHENFATNATIVHNCQEDDTGHLFKVKCKNEEIKEELEFLLYKLIEANDKMWSWAKNLYKYGDTFLEIVVDPHSPKRGVLKVQHLPSDSMYRIETIKGKLIEFQQSREGPDYQSLAKTDILRAHTSELQQCTALRFAPEQIIHMRIGDDRKTFYPYGVSMIEAARGPAHQLHMMEDAMLVYRLTRAPERRVFYVDIGQLAPNKAEAFIERMKDQFRKKKIFARRGTQVGASAVEERYVPPAADEDYWLPMRANSTTRIETLPGAQNLGEIDDALYFRNKLYVALMFPKNYLSNQDPQASRLTLAQQDTRFARLIERLQKPLGKAMYEVAVRHLRFRGWPEEEFKDLEIKMTPPSDWRQINRNEVNDALYNRAATMKGTQLMSDFDILVRILNIDEDDAKEIVARSKAQKLEDLQMQAIGANPALLGLQPPENDGIGQIGTTPAGPNPMLGNDQQQPGQQPQPGQEQPADQGQDQMPPPEQGQQQQPPQPEPGEKTPPQQINKLPEPTPEDIKKYNLDIADTDTGVDEEETDDGELGDD